MSERIDAQCPDDDPRLAAAYDSGTEWIAIMNALGMFDRPATPDDVACQMVEAVLVRAAERPTNGRVSRRLRGMCGMGYVEKTGRGYGYRGPGRSREMRNRTNEYQLTAKGWAWIEHDPNSLYVRAYGKSA